MLLKKILRTIDRFVAPNVVFAHCDIPCGIYDPIEAQIAAHSVLRMATLISQFKIQPKEPDFEERKKIISQISRLTKIKEESAEKVKSEIRIIWGDFIKPEQLETNKDIHSKVFEIMKLASKNKQEINIDEAQKLLECVLQFSELFWQLKGKNPKRIDSNFPTAGQLVIAS